MLVECQHWDERDVTTQGEEQRRFLCVYCNRERVTLWCDPCWTLMYRNGKYACSVCMRSFVMVADYVGTTGDPG